MDISKDTKKEGTAIEPGKPIKIEAATRKEVTKKVAEIRKQAAEQGLTETAGGFIYRVKKDFLDPGIFVTEINFKQK